MTVLHPKAFLIPGRGPGSAPKLPGSSGGMGADWWPWLWHCPHPAAGRALLLSCIVLFSKVKKPVKKQPSELSRKPNQKEKRGRTEEKPRNKSASPLPSLVLSPLGTGPFLCHFLALPGCHLGVGMSTPMKLLLGQQQLWRGQTLTFSSSPRAGGGVEGTRLSFPGLFHLTGEDAWGITLGLEALPQGSSGS